MKRNRSQHGFTLMEATMAMVILAIAASGIFMSFAAAASVQTEAQRRIIASRLAADKIEQIAATDYASIAGSSEPAGQLKDCKGLTITGSIYEGLSRSAVCTEVPVNGVKLIQATVEVQYNGVPVTKLTTLIGDLNPHY
jgi:prepilin-type N-terminal cleavage/methylation domain-containing protein